VSDAIANAAQRRERESTIAYLLDRAEQYRNDSACRAVFDELVEGLADGRHVQCCAAGEYADLYPRVARIMRSFKP